MGAGVLLRLMNPAEPHAVSAPLRWATAVGIAAVMVVLAERLIPLRGLSREKWVWRYRRQRRLPALDPAILVQGAASAAVGAFLGAASGHSLVAVVGMSVAVAAARLGVGWARGWGSDLPRLLAAGRTRALVENLAGLQDTELVSDLLVMNWLRGSSRKRWGCGARGTSLTVLGLRRLWRRGYVLYFAAAVAAWQVTLAPAYGEWGRAATVLAWGIVCAAVYRATDFTRVARFSTARFSVARFPVAWGICAPAWAWGRPPMGRGPKARRRWR
ncbi:hypothetical protein Cocul_01007 [Corynebacterium oculi]|uniref:Uncharacterized protein n=2 Tax=Corynebacterium oculi TaxID=1544416 RepID=A0A0N8VZL2_9CORY|nr:hypothetical protein Cocul_01007 [Corynebacterium oculi]